jgi:hypothetical protein
LRFWRASYWRSKSAEALHGNYRGEEEVRPA